MKFKFLLWLCIFLFGTAGALCIFHFKTSHKTQYYSQCKQDRWINKKIFKNQSHEVFVDIGAHDGKTINNTYFFEKELHWTGVCVEPLPEVFQKLQLNRNCLCIRGGIAAKDGWEDFMQIHGPLEMFSGLVNNYSPQHIELIQKMMLELGGYCETIKIHTFNINDLLEQNRLFAIDLLSLDTEGGELEILKSIDFNRFQIRVITVENNYHDENFQKFMLSQGYKRVECLGVDEVYLKNL